MKKKIVLFVLLFCVSFAFCEETTQILDLRAYLNQAIEAIEQEHYDKAIKIYDEAERYYPESYLPNSYKGDLYKKNKLYNSAIIEYEKSLSKNKKSMTVYDDLAECYSNLGNDKKTIEVYKLAFDNIYQSSDLYNSLAWAYIKANRTDECLTLLHEALEKYPNLADLLVTLGSAYYSAGQYENAKNSYLAAEKNSFKQLKDAIFRSIVKYNQASLEHTFGHYEEAFVTANTANEYMQRSSAHVLLADWYCNMLEYDKALEEIKLAASLQPITLYPDLLLARVFLLTNDLDKAEVVINKLLNNNDHKWMSSFSTNLDEYYVQVYNLVFELYKSKANLAYANIDNPIKRFFLKQYYCIKSYIYKIRYANLCLKIGQAQIKGGSSTDGLESMLSGYSEFDIFSGKSLKLVKILDDIETVNKPFKKTHYAIYASNFKYMSDLFYSRQKNCETISKYINDIDKKWEKNLLEEAYKYMMKCSKDSEKQKYLQQLFFLSPYSIATLNVPLKVNIELPQSYSKKEKQSIISELKKYKLINDKKSEITLQVYIGVTDVTVLVVHQNKIIHTLTTKNPDVSKSDANKIWNCIFVK